MQTVWRRYPGTLTARSLQEIKRSLVTSAGTMWNVDRSSLPPLYTIWAAGGDPPPCHLLSSKKRSPYAKPWIISSKGVWLEELTSSIRG